MKREYIFILITIVVAVSGLVYKGMFVSDKLNETQNIITENNDSHAKFKRDTVVQRNSNNMIELHKLNKRDSRTYGEVIADLLKITEDILKESKIEYDVNDINQEQETKKNKDWPNRKESFFINANFSTNYINLINFINIIEQHDLLINISSLTYERERPKTKAKDSRNKEVQIDKYSTKNLLSVVVRLEYVKFL